MRDPPAAGRLYERLFGAQPRSLANAVLSATAGQKKTVKSTRVFPPITHYTPPNTSRYTVCTGETWVYTWSAYFCIQVSA
jgi:hypothetical protein